MLISQCATSGSVRPRPYPPSAAFGVVNDTSRPQPEPSPNNPTVTQTTVTGFFRLLLGWVKTVNVPRKYPMSFVACLRSSSDQSDLVRCAEDTQSRREAESHAECQHMFQMMATIRQIKGIREDEKMTRRLLWPCSWRSHATYQPTTITRTMMCWRSWTVMMMTSAGLSTVKQIKNYLTD